MLQITLGYSSQNKKRETEINLPNLLYFFDFISLVYVLCRHSSILLVSFRCKSARAIFFVISMFM